MYEPNEMYVEDMDFDYTEDDGLTPSEQYWLELENEMNEVGYNE